MNKKLVLGTTILAIVVLTPSIWACTESQTSEAPIPSPPITPVTPGYIWGYDHQLGYEFEYPEDWEMQVPQFESPYEKVEVFTKKGEPTQIKILVNWATTPPDKPITRGLYRYSRNPSYVAGIIIHLGVGIAAASWLLLAYSVVYMVGISAYIRAEEEGCLEKYGDSYREYMDKTPRWIGIPKS